MATAVSDLLTMSPAQLDELFTRSDSGPTCLPRENGRLGTRLHPHPTSKRNEIGTHACLEFKR
jgi:hypothetical protein